MTSVEILGANYSTLCGQAVAGNIFSVFTLALQIASLVFWVIWLIRSGLSCGFSLQKWFHLFRTCSYVTLAIQVLLLFFKKTNKQYTTCGGVYYNGNWLWCRIVIFILVIVALVFALISFLPCVPSNKVLVYIDFFAHCALIVFIWIQHLPTTCDIGQVGWRIVHNDLTLFAMPTCQLLAHAMYTFNVALSAASDKSASNKA
ncbi:hypothetical protein BLNAU_14018 [Blattamonas nauphoetae]|uniref:Transmembrane protein n=1 Tax=Blattamonas nauphoetae TaxID=2049346 RepID=A0ABQ9XKB9_9EUKA|nr:hypothetical protein BLNAU_14018 [Blattamonas nauphoetae]